MGITLPQMMQGARLAWGQHRGKQDKAANDAEFPLYKSRLSYVLLFFAIIFAKISFLEVLTQAEFSDV